MVKDRITTMAPLILPRLPTAPGHARRYLRPRFTAMGFSAAKIEDMLVAVGEAVTNAVVHGGPDGQVPDMDAVIVQLVVRDSDLTIAVTSPRTGWRASSPHAHADPTAESGRGLLMIQNLTDAWRMRQGAEGTTIYLTWRLPRPHAGSPARPAPSRSRRRRRAS
jgi:anti-sigma regulatory factor (Ser/Thr protein kinase)